MLPVYYYWLPGVICELTVMIRGGCDVASLDNALKTPKTTAAPAEPRDHHHKHYKQQQHLYGVLEDTHTPTAVTAEKLSDN